MFLGESFHFFGRLYMIEIMNQHSVMAEIAAGWQRAGRFPPIAKLSFNLFDSDEGIYFLGLFQISQIIDNLLMMVGWR